MIALIFDKQVAIYYIKIGEIKLRVPKLNTLVAKHIGNATISLFSDDHGISMNLKNSNITIESNATNSSDLNVTTHYPSITAARMASNDILDRVRQNQTSYKHILKSDAYHYYESIDHHVLLTALENHVDCKIINDLVAQYCQRLETRDGVYYHFTQGIPMGCPLSPLMAALYLKPLDDEMKKHGFYIRFMDDWVIMVKTKHQLRKIIKLTHKILSSLKLKMHPDKTFLGCIKKGFDFLGVHFGDTLKISTKSLEKNHSRLGRRYAQGASAACIGRYIERWTSWCERLLKLCHEACSKLSMDLDAIPHEYEMGGFTENQNEDFIANYNN